MAVWQRPMRNCTRAPSKSGRRAVTAMTGLSLSCPSVICHGAISSCSPFFLLTGIHRSVIKLVMVITYPYLINSFISTLFSLTMHYYAARNTSSPSLRLYLTLASLPEAWSATPVHSSFSKTSGTITAFRPRSGIEAIASSTALPRLPS